MSNEGSGDELLGDDILAEFRAESLEHIGAVEAALLELEQKPNESGIVHRAFRSAHSLKGAAGFLGRADIVKLTHAMEDLLDLLRSGTVQVDAEAMCALLEAADHCRLLFDRSPVDPTDPTITRLRETLDGERLRLKAAARAATEDPNAARVEADSPQEAEQSLPSLPPIEPPSAPLPRLFEWQTATVKPPPTGRLKERRQATLAEIEERSKVVPPAARPLPSPQVEAATKTAAETSEPPKIAAEQSIRVDVQLLDDLMNLVGELVVARNGLVRSLHGTPAELNKAIRRVDQLTSELQSRATKTRMRPISAAWGSVGRTVRDLSAQTGKRVRIEMEGQDTELDRASLDALKDPLNHIIRNAVDHGIELPETRLAAGKSPIGLISLRASHAGGVVLIEVADDGKGIDPTAIRESAVRKGLLSEADAKRLSDAQALELIFLPGFSTAASVTNLSGRGVGMDVVRTQLRGIGGTVEVSAKPGQGTTLRLRLPLTLAILPALVVEAGEDRFCVPQDNLREIVDLQRLQESAIQQVAGARVLRHRGALLPLLALGPALNLTEHIREGTGAIVVCEADGGRVGLVVDDLLGVEEIVVKPLSPELKLQGLWAGATVRGDGRVTLILDIASLGRAARALQQAPEEPEADRRITERCLRVNIEEDGQAFIALSHVLRCEDLSDARVYRQGQRQLANLAGELVVIHPLTAAPKMVVFCTHEGKKLALGVSEVIDVQQVERAFTAGVGPSWSLGTSLYQNQPVAWMDLRAVLHQHAVGPVLSTNDPSGSTR
jgi:two-component system chemotaxis sensor kinase CheA